MGQMKPQVQPDDVVYGVPTVAVIHFDIILCAVHLLHVFSKNLVLKQLKHEQTLDTFISFYVNKYADHHTFKVAFQ